MPARQTASKSNREAARKTNTRQRRNRLLTDVIMERNSQGDFTNRTAMRNDNKAYTGQNFGTHKSRYDDLVAAFGRVRKKDMADIEAIRNGTAEFGPDGKKLSLAFSNG